MVLLLVLDKGKLNEIKVFPNNAVPVDSLSLEGGDKGFAGDVFPN